MNKVSNLNIFGRFCSYKTMKNVGTKPAKLLTIRVYFWIETVKPISQAYNKLWQKKFSKFNTPDTKRLIRTMKEECIGLKNTKRSFWYKNNYLNQLYNYRRVTFYLWLPLKNSHKNCLIIKVWYRRNIKSWFVIHSAQKKKKGTGSNVQRMFSSEKKSRQTQSPKNFGTLDILHYTLKNA